MTRARVADRAKQPRTVHLQLHDRDGIQLLVTRIDIATANAILRLVYAAHGVRPPGTLTPPTPSPPLVRGMTPPMIAALRRLLALVSAVPPSAPRRRALPQGRGG